MFRATVLTTYRKNHPRLTNHYGLALFSLAGCVVVSFIGGPEQPILDTLSLGMGYVALLLVLLTLVIGPINMLKKRKNPVNMMFRRDAGIWAGITAIFHMVFSFLLYFGGNLLLYFFAQNGSGLSFSFDIFYLSNYVGLIAGLVILFLLVLSNNYFLKIFKGPKWKQLQRFNYLLFVVALLHSLGEQLTNSRNLVLTFGVIALAGIVVIAQSIGFLVYQRRDQQRKAASSTTAGATSNRGLPKNPGATALPAPSIARGLPLQPAYAFVQTDKGVGRRRFLLVSGTVMLSGLVGGLSAKVIAKNSETSITTANDNSTNEGTTTAITTSTAVQSNSSGSTAAPSPSATTDNNTSSTPVTSAATTTSGVATAAVTTNVPTTSAVTSTTAATATRAATTAATAATTGTVLATIVNLAAGKAIAFTTPDTKAAAFLVHRQDGSVTCFSGICTHEPVKLTFDASQQTLYCPKHGVPFDTQTGAPQRGPARTALAKYKVTVDSQGQIIYG